jgi:hypothetical protein
MLTPTQIELDAINKAVADSGAVRIRKTTKAALAAFERGECTTDSVGAWVAKQKIVQPELFQAKPTATNPWDPRFPADKKVTAISDFIRKFGAAASSRMAASIVLPNGNGVDIAGRELKRRA